ncbi:HAMP domain-containing histidine kinase [Mucilaginibacter pallidiroseus]|uniref:histidine kinase n=1 Tax=Mucilaginibacter pallidiroseus TaxID=2599295 RepID=A0A563UJ13_9SPHI|nr:HAMP domain-containing sensor histidine kinase [Mucilaginibacter pallidiroseus]TWR31299.1 HAMP domain-containing histidine kinase [Mucilaginibacter pallidiroseus]
MISIRAVKMLGLIALILVLNACNFKKEDSNARLTKKLSAVDSLFFVGKTAEAIKLAHDVRGSISKTDPLVTTYYNLMAGFVADRKTKELYADSSLAFFKAGERSSSYQNYYVKALFTKGDVAMFAKQYNEAFDYYSKAKTLLKKSSCDNGYMASKTAEIYYIQKNYRVAARYSARAFELLNNCNDYQPQKLFHLKQAALNNAAFSYEQSGLIDSALYFYRLSYILLNSAHTRRSIPATMINSSLVVLYDNMGGLYLSKDSISKAKDYLLKAVNTNVPETNGSKIPPRLKLAKLYLKTGEYDKAAIQFDSTRFLLNKYRGENASSDLKWNRLYAEYLVKTRQSEQAYQYINNYIRLNDSLERVSANIYKLDIDREQDLYKQEQAYQTLKHSDKLKMLYILFATIAVILLSIIIALINKNLGSSRESQKVTASQNKELQQTLVELEAANKNYIRIMRIMAHDLRNPLAGISGLTLVLLEDNELNEENKQILQLIESTCTNSIGMINELLKSGLANENDVLDLQSLDIKALLHDSVKLLHFKAKEKNQELIFDADDAPVRILGSQEKVWRIFNNLIVNAIKFSHAGGKIKVDIALTDNRTFALTTVTDNGIGIDEADKDHIFEMFTKAKRQGTGGEEPFGLGLSITKKIVEQHGGKIWFTSQDGETVFFVKLPLIK